MDKLRFTIILTLSTSILVLFQNCKDKSIEQINAPNQVVLDDVRQIKNKETSIDFIIDRYAKQLNNSEIKIVDSITCGQIDNNIINYEKGILTYGYNSINTNSSNGKLAGDLDGDNQTDYIANYYCENCYGGNGSDNYLSNCFFLTSKNNQVIVNEEMTNDFKQKLIEKIKEDFGDPYFSKAEKERMINGIEFTKIQNQIVYGTFNINTEACQGSPFPCAKGTFEYDVNNKNLKMSGNIAVEE